jgi:anti-sigma factor RsiW
MRMKHLTETDRERMQRGELTAAERLQILRHVAACADCRERVPFDDRTVARFRRNLHAEAETHLNFDAQSASYVDGVLDAAEREIVEGHLEDCAMCRAEIADLQRLRDELAHGTTTQHTLARRRSRVAALAAAAVVAIAFLTLREDPPPSPMPPAPPPVVAAAQSTPLPPPPEPHALDPAWQTLIATSLATATLPFPADLSALTPAAEVPRGTAALAEDPFEPAGIVVDDTSPSFAWPSRAGAQYVVAVFDGEEEVLRSASLREPRWSARTALRRGRTYAWQVEVMLADGTTDILPAPPAPPALFRITTTTAHDELARAHREHPDDHLLLAVLQARAGMKREALAELALVAANDPRVATLLERYRDRRKPL